MNNPQKVIGVDLGGTNVRSGIVSGSTITKLISFGVNVAGSKEDVLENIYSTVDPIFNNDISGMFFKNVFGGSISKAFPLFRKKMMEGTRQFEFKRSVPNLKIAVSGLENSAILGAAALFFENKKTIA